MNGIDWSKVLELIIPILVAFIGGYIALRNMRKNIKLNHKLKMKEELRQIFIDMTMNLHQLNNAINEILNTDNNEVRIDNSHKAKIINDNILKHFLLISLYFKEDDKNYEKYSKTLIGELNKVTQYLQTENKSDIKSIDIHEVFSSFQKLHSTIKL